MAWRIPILVHKNTNCAIDAGPNVDFCPFQIMVRPETHPTIWHVKNKIKAIFNITKEIYIFQEVYKTTSFLPDNEDVAILEPTFNDNPVMVTTDETIVRQILDKVVNFKKLGLTTEVHPVILGGETQSHPSDETRERSTCETSAASGLVTAPEAVREECQEELVDQTLSFDNTTTTKNHVTMPRRTQVFKPPKKSLSVGEFLNSLRQNSDLSETVPSVNSTIDMPEKRKRVRKHKKRKMEPNSTPENISSPKSVAHTFSGGAKSTRIVFSEVEEEGEVEVVSNEENGEMHGSSIDGDCLSQMNGTNESTAFDGDAVMAGDVSYKVENALENLYSLRELHGNPLVFKLNVSN